MLTIFLRKQSVICPIGVHEFERLQGVKLLISVEVSFSVHPDQDQLSQTLDYTELVDIVNQKAAKPQLLLETLAQEIAVEIKKRTAMPMEKINIRIEKPQIPHVGFQAEACGIAMEFRF
jgi:dihydroneopterin aldolase